MTYSIPGEVWLTCSFCDVRFVVQLREPAKTYPLYPDGVHTRSEGELAERLAETQLECRAAVDALARLHLTLHHHELHIGGPSVAT